MGSTQSTIYSDDISSMMWGLSISADDVMERRGQIEADGIMAVKFSDKHVSVPRASKIFWVGVLLVKNNWIHTGIGIHNDITVKFNSGIKREYKYMVAHGVAKEKRFQVYLSFANDYDAIYENLAEAFGTKVNYSFTPVIAGDTWTTSKVAADVVRKMEQYIDLKFNMECPGPGETNCVHFSVAMYLFFASKDESKLLEISHRLSGDFRDRNYKSLLRKLRSELEKIK